ncbi:MAG: bactofilin family protein [Bacteroidia bacterium]
MIGNSKQKSTSSSQGLLNLVGAGTVIKGDIKCSGDIRIDGTVEGNVEVSQKVVVGITGIVVGNIQSEDTSISGKVVGNIKSDKSTVLHGSGTINGDISTKQIIIEQGGNFNGVCKMDALSSVDTSQNNINNEQGE